MSYPRFAFFQGQIVPIEQATVSITTHALNYGTAAFGGVRAYWNAQKHDLFIFRPVDHFTRLLESARLLFMNIPYTAEQMRDILVELLRREDYHEDVYVRPLVYVSLSGIGVKLDLPSDFSMFAIPFGGYVDNEEGLHLGTSSWRRVDDTAIPARGKIAGAYANSALIKTEALKNGFDEALVLNNDGHISEASAANIFMIRRGQAVTPPISSNILEGITRRTMMILLKDELGIPVVEREIDRTELYNADEVFLCGTGVQIAAVTKVDHRNIGAGVMGDAVRQLRRIFFETVRGNMPQYAAWNQAVYAPEVVPTISA